MKTRHRSRSFSRRYALGIDFGTLSGRALLVDLATGEEVATAVYEYAHGCIEETLPGSRNRLPPDFALQQPSDYLEALYRTVPRVMNQARIRPEQVVGIGTDFTSCTMLPTTASGEPLCWDRRWRRQPHAWVKLWKHHAAQSEADDINRVGREQGEGLLKSYGGRYSSEWFFSKLLETVRSAPAIYDAADRFLEAGDWIVWQLCGAEQRSLSAAGFKAMRVCPDGQGGWTYPPPSFFRALHPKLADVVREKLSVHCLPPGAKAGGLTSSMAARLGLLPGIPVAVGNIDAHVAVPACGVTEPGAMVMILGTSTCQLLVGHHSQEVEGVCGVVQDGVVPGTWGYEAGQAGVGDMFAWYLKHAVPASVNTAAAKARLGVYEFLEREAAALAPGECGVLALDWWNGCRSVLMDSELSGLLVGATLGTRPHHIYRGLLEATGFGTRRILEAFTGQGVEIDRLVACGGLAHRSPLLMQLYADITGRPIDVALSEQACALGAAMHGAVAGQHFKSMKAAASVMSRVSRNAYKPRRAHRTTYDLLFREYARLQDLFGRDPKSLMKTLRRLRTRRGKLEVVGVVS